MPGGGGGYSVMGAFQMINSLGPGGVTLPENRLAETAL